MSFGLFAGFVLSGGWDRLTTQGAIYVDGVNESGTMILFGSATPYELKAGCANCPVTPAPGSTFEMIWSVSNYWGPNATETYTTLSIGNGSGWSGTITPQTPFTVGPYLSQIIDLKATVPDTPGSYFVPVTLDFTVH